MSPKMLISASVSRPEVKFAADVIIVGIEGSTEVKIEIIVEAPVIAKGASLGIVKLNPVNAAVAGSVRELTLEVIAATSSCFLVKFHEHQIGSKNLQSSSLLSH